MKNQNFNQNPNKNKKTAELLTDYTQNGNTAALMELARRIVKKTLGKSTTLYELYKANQNPNTDNQEIKDLKSIAILGILQAIHDQTNPVITAHRYVNNYLYNNRSIPNNKRPLNYSIEYLTEHGTELVNISKNINKILTDQTDIYTIDDTDTERQQQRELIRKILTAIKTEYSKTAKTKIKIIKLLAENNSQRQIAEKMNISPAYVNKNIQQIRKIANEIKQNDQTTK